MRHTLLILLCGTLIFACKKDDDNTTGPDGTGGGGNPAPKDVSCEYLQSAIYDSSGKITYGFIYHYTGDRLDSATPQPGVNLFTYHYTYTDGGSTRRTDYSYNGQLYGSYTIETFNDFGDVLTEDAYDANNNGTSSKINEYSCGHVGAVSGNKYCIKTKQSYYSAATNETTITNYYYTGTRLDSTVTDKGYKIAYEYLDDNTRKKTVSFSGIKTDGYNIEKINEFGKAIEITQYNKDGVKTGFSEYIYKCD